MVNEASDRAFADVGEVIAANLHRLRTARRMSLATLAARADVAKATLANLEQGRGNPTIETLWSLALGLGVAFSDLLEDPCLDLPLLVVELLLHDHPSEEV